MGTGAGPGSAILARMGILAGVIAATTGSAASAKPVDRAQTVLQNVEGVDSVRVAVTCMLGQKWMSLAST
jgi:hypothetical protein